MTIKKFFFMNMLFISLGCKAVQPAEELFSQPEQSMASSIGLSQEAAQTVFEEKMSNILKSVWSGTFRAVLIDFHCRFFNEIAWLEKNYVLNPEQGNQLIDEMAQIFIKEGSLDALVVNLRNVLNEQGLPADVVELALHNFKEMFIKMLIPSMKESVIIRSTVYQKIKLQASHLKYAKS